MRKHALALAYALMCGAALVTAESAWAQTQCDPAKGEIPWTSEPVNARECTCSDLPTLLDALASAKRYRDLYEAMAADIRALESAGMTPADSRDEWLNRNAAGAQAIQQSEGASGTFATTDGVQCTTCIPVQTLGSQCRAILQAAWMHEKVHRDVCHVRRRAGTGPLTVPGSDHAIEERDAYAANIPVLVAEIERLLEKVTIDWTTSGSDYKESGQVTLDQPVVPAPQDRIVVGGQGSVKVEFKTFNDFATVPIAGMATSCKVVGGLPKTINVTAQLNVRVTSPARPIVLTVQDVGTPMQVSFECPRIPRRPFPFPIRYAGVAFHFDWPIKDGAKAIRVEPPSPPAKYHQNFSATVTCRP
ncbi:MAG: hypothetical protein ACREON_01520 [Gemmatimonadaceae bacterium]